MSHVSCLTYLVSRILSHSRVSRLLSHVSCLTSHISCLSSPVLHLLAPVSRLTSPVSHLMSNITCLTFPVSHLLSYISCLISHVFYPMSPVSRLLSHFSCLPNNCIEDCVYENLICSFSYLMFQVFEGHWGLRNWKEIFQNVYKHLIRTEYLSNFCKLDKQRERERGTFPYRNPEDNIKQTIINDNIHGHLGTRPFK